MGKYKRSKCKRRFSANDKTKLLPQSSNSHNEIVSHFTATVLLNNFKSPYIFTPELEEITVELNEQTIM
jgi:hypothetical protein